MENTSEYIHAQASLDYIAKIKREVIMRFQDMIDAPECPFYVDCRETLETTCKIEELLDEEFWGIEKTPRRLTQTEDRADCRAMHREHSTYVGSAA